MKIRPVEAELFRKDIRTDRQERVSSCFSQFCERAQKKVWHLRVNTPHILSQRCTRVCL
jgi:hypothetical protein